MDLIFGSDINSGEFTIDIAIIYQAINSLKDLDAKMVIMRLEGYSYQDICDETGAPIGTVKGNISRSRRKLRNYLSADDIGMVSTHQS